MPFGRTVEEAVHTVKNVEEETKSEFLLNAALQDVEEEMKAASEEDQELADILFQAVRAEKPFGAKSWLVTLEQRTLGPVTKAGQHSAITKNPSFVTITTAGLKYPSSSPPPQPFGDEIDVVASASASVFNIISDDLIIFELKDSFDIPRVDAVLSWNYHVIPDDDEPTLQMCRKVLRRDISKRCHVMKYILNASNDARQGEHQRLDSMSDCLQYHDALNTSYEKMDRSQKKMVQKAVRREQGVLLCSGPPGTGKSRTMVVTASCKIETQPRKKKILYICPSNSAGATFQRALLKNKSAMQILKPLRVVAGYMQPYVSNELQQHCLHHKVQEEMAKIEALSRKYFDENEEQSDYRGIQKEDWNEALYDALSPGSTSSSCDEKTADNVAKLRRQTEKRIISMTHLIIGTPMKLKTLIDQHLITDIPGTIIVDEAANMNFGVGFACFYLFPKCVDKILFVLVGDIHQLPAVVKSAQAKVWMLSMMHLIMLCGPQQKNDNHCSLRMQYRVPFAAFGWSRDVFYPDIAFDRSCYEMGKVTKDIEQLGLANANVIARWIDIESKPRKDGTSFSNLGQIHVIIILISLLLRTSSQMTIGVIAPYKAMVFETKRKLEESLPTESFQRIKIGTIDSFQGSERDVIILALTTTKVGNFVDKHRLNVAVTRLISFMFIVGDIEGIMKHEKKKESEKQSHSLGSYIASAKSSAKRNTGWQISKTSKYRRFWEGDVVIFEPSYRLYSEQSLVTRYSTVSGPYGDKCHCVQLVRRLSEIEKYFLDYHDQKAGLSEWKFQINSHDNILTAELILHHGLTIQVSHFQLDFKAATTAHYPNRLSLKLHDMENQNYEVLSHSLEINNNQKQLHEIWSGKYATKIVVEFGYAYDVETFSKALKDGIEKNINLYGAVEVRNANMSTQYRRQLMKSLWNCAIPH